MCVRFSVILNASLKAYFFSGWLGSRIRLRAELSRSLVDDRYVWTTRGLCGMILNDSQVALMDRYISARRLRTPPWLFRGLSCTPLELLECLVGVCHLSCPAVAPHIPDVVCSYQHGSSLLHGHGPGRNNEQPHWAADGIDLLQ